MAETSSEKLPLRVVREVERYLEEMKADLRQFDSQFLASFADTSDWRVLLVLLEDYYPARFNLMAEWLLFLSVAPTSAHINPLYEDYLGRVIDEKVLPHLLVVLKHLRADLREDAISRIELKLLANKLHWLAEADRRHALRTSGSFKTVKRQGKNAGSSSKSTEKLPPKTSDLSDLFTDARLTSRQSEIASLAWERGMSKVGIAKFLQRDRKTIDESLASSQRRIDLGRMKTKAAARRARRDPYEQR